MMKSSMPSAERPTPNYEALASSLFNARRCGEGMGMEESSVMGNQRGRFMRVDGKSNAVMSEGKFQTMHRLRCRRPAGQARQDPHAAPAILGLLEKDATAPQGKAVMLGAKLECGPRFLTGQDPWFGCAAEIFHRTDFTLWSHTADERAQFHKGGIMLASISAREEL